MKYRRYLLPVTAVVLALCLVIVSLVYAAVPWTKYPGELSLTDVLGNDELFVMDAWVIKDGATYKMWYTHGKTALSIGEIAASLVTILTDDIINDIASLDIEALLGDLSGVDVDALWDFLGAISTVVGYAESSDGIDWTVQNSEVLAGGGAGGWDSIGSPCVVKTVTGYEMWYTHFTMDLTKAELGTILIDLGNPLKRKDAMAALIASMSSVIEYTTSVDGVSWAAPQEVLAGSSGGIWDSVATPRVVETGASYEMWYTRAKTSLTQAEFDTIMDNIGSLSMTELMNILDATSSVIEYTTSGDGISWAAPQEVLAGSSGGVWDSVATPTVVKTGSSYEMWFSQATTDLTETSLQTLIYEIQALPLADLWATAKSGDYTQLLTDLIDLIDLDMDAIKALLANTGSVIGYATSGDGITWDVQNAEAFVGTSLWSSVASPSVILNAGVYEMWFTQGIDELTVSNLVAVLQGLILPIGYATGFNLVAETSDSLDKDTDNVVVVLVNIDRGKNSYTGSTEDIPGGIDTYTAVATRDPAGIALLEVRGVSPFDNPTFNPGTGVFSVAVVSPPTQPSNTTIAKIVIRLIGDALTPYDLTTAFQFIGADSSPGMNVPEENPNTLTFLRGDTNDDGVVNIVDAMFIAQYIVGLRQLSEINPINAACVNTDGGSGDIINIVDAMFIAQYIVGIRDANYNLVP